MYSKFNKSNVVKTYSQMIKKERFKSFDYKIKLQSWLKNSLPLIIFCNKSESHNDIKVWVPKLELASSIWLCFGILVEVYISTSIINKITFFF